MKQNRLWIIYCLLPLALLTFTYNTPAVQSMPARMQELRGSSSGSTSGDWAASAPESAGATAAANNQAVLATATVTPTTMLTSTATPPVGPYACLPDSPWSQTFLPDSTFINEIQLLQDGSYLLRGRIDGSEGTWLAKMDASGRLIWQNVYGVQMGTVRLGPGGNIVLEFRRTFLELGPDGKVIRTYNLPWYQPNADGGFTTIINQSVIRYKDASTPLWQVEVKDFAGLNTTTSDGGAFLAYAGVYIDRSVYYAPQYTDIKVIKISPDGSVFQRVYGKLVGDETLDYLQNTSDGGALMAGTHAYELLGSDYDIWLMKFNTGGSLTWQSTLKLAPHNETLRNIFILKKGFLVEVSTYERNDPVLIRINANGSLGWQKIITSIRGEVEITTAADTADGGLLLAGKTWEKTPVYWLAKLDARGRLVWEKTLGYELPGEPDSDVWSILPLESGKILVGGLTNQVGSRTVPEFSAWVAQIADAGQPLGLIKLLPGKFNIISTLGSRPNTLPDEILSGGAAAPVKEASFSVLETKLQPVPACLPSGAYFPTPSALPSLTPTVTPTLALIRHLYLTDPPMEGDDVLNLQKRLYELGYTEVGARDGLFGRMTNTAVRNFQERNNLEVDGYVGPKTWSRLFSTQAIRAGK